MHAFSSSAPLLRLPFHPHPDPLPSREMVSADVWGKRRQFKLATASLAQLQNKGPALVRERRRPFKPASHLRSIAFPPEANTAWSTRSLITTRLHQMHSDCFAQGYNSTRKAARLSSYRPSSQSRPLYWAVSTIRFPGRTPTPPASQGRG